MSKLAYEKKVTVAEKYETVELDLPWYGVHYGLFDTNTYVHISESKVVTTLKVEEDFGTIDYELNVEDKFHLSEEGWYHFFKNIDFKSDKYTESEMKQHLKNMKNLTGGLL